jgi:hypothetical protein
VVIAAAGNTFTTRLSVVPRCRSNEGSSSNWPRPRKPVSHFACNFPINSAPPTVFFQFFFFLFLLFRIALSRSSTATFDNSHETSILPSFRTAPRFRRRLRFLLFLSSLFFFPVPFFASLEMSTPRTVAPNANMTRIRGGKSSGFKSSIPVPVRSLSPVPPTDSGRVSRLRSGIPLPVRVLTASPSQEVSSVGKGRKSPVALRVVSKTVGAAGGSNKASVPPPSRPSLLNNKGKGNAAGVAACRSADRASSVQATRGAEESSEARPKGILKKSLRFAYRKVSNHRIAF